MHASQGLTFPDSCVIFVSVRLFFLCSAPPKEKKHRSAAVFLYIYISKKSRKRPDMKNGGICAVPSSSTCDSMGLWET